MNEEKIMAVIEAVLFAMGDSVELSKLQHVLEIPEEEIRGMIQLMNETYKKTGPRHLHHGVGERGSTVYEARTV